jgi:hypothetical protein
MSYRSLAILEVLGISISLVAACNMLSGCSSQQPTPPELSGVLKKGMTFDAALAALGPAESPATFAGSVSGGVSTLNFIERRYRVVLTIILTENGIPRTTLAACDLKYLDSMSSNCAR